MSQEPGQRLTERQGLGWTYRMESRVKQLLRLEILWLTDGGDSFSYSFTGRSGTGMRVICRKLR
jgi:hypothetical protein